MKKPRLVLVDDEPDFIELFVKALLAECPVALITTYSSGINFLSAWPLLTDEERPNLILLDMNMPFTDGLNVTRAIRSSPTHQAIPILMVTSIERKEVVEQAYQYGINAFLVKPFTYQEMRQLAKDICTYWIQMGVLPYR